MIGADGVTSLVSQSLAERVEARLAVLDAELGVLATASPLVPTFISPTQVPFDSVGLDDWPFVLVVPQGDVSTVRTDVAPTGAARYDVAYDMRVFVWVRGDGFADTSAVLRRLTLALKEALLVRLRLADGAAVDPTTLAIRYSDVGTDTHLQATVAASWLSFRVKTTESVTPEAGPYPVTVTVGTTGTVLPAVPVVPPAEQRSSDTP